MNPPPITLGKMVVHVANYAKQGVVTAILFRTNGNQVGVTWDDLSERWHGVAELRTVSDKSNAVQLPR